MASGVANADRLLARTARTIELVKVLAPRELRARYRQSVLTIGWAVVTPVAILAVYGIVLTKSFGVVGTCAPYLVTAWCGLVIWTFVANGLGAAVGSLVQSSDLITKVYFPREAMPLATVAAAVPDLGIGFLTVVGLAYAQGVRPGPEALVVVVPLLLVVVWTAAAGVVVAVLASFTRDLIHGVQLALRVGFFATPVMYEVGFVPEAFAWTSRWNPVAVAITATRTTLLCGNLPSMTLLGAHFAAAIALLVGAVAYTRAVEGRLVDVV